MRDLERGSSHQSAHGQKLTDLMIEHNVGVRLNRAIEFKRLDEDFFAEDD